MSETELGFDAVVAKLRAVVERLETGQLGLEEALAVYEQGVALARRGHQLLDAAEKKVELLVSASGTIETAPLDPSEATE
jgi:exodeoxyribonuclease VII small subunit